MAPPVICILCSEELGIINILCRTSEGAFHVDVETVLWELIIPIYESCASSAVPHTLSSLAASLVPLLLITTSEMYHP